MKRFWILTTVALAAGVFVAISAGPAPGAPGRVAQPRAVDASPHMAAGQWSSPDFAFVDCQQGAGPAMKAEGMPTVNKGPSRSWYGRSSNGPVSAVIICYEGGNGDVWATIAVAHHSSFAAARAVALALQKRLFGDGNTFTSGTYNADTVVNGTHYPGKWVVTVNGNKITGQSSWTCCPGPRTDLLTGTVTGSRVVVVRDCSGQGAAGNCSQTYTGKVVEPGRVTGTFSGSGVSGSGSFTLTRVSG